jgi:hypothetical protein
MMLCGVSVVFKSLGDVFHDLRRRAQTVLKWYGPKYAFCFGGGTVPRGTVLGTGAPILWCCNGSLAVPRGTACPTGPIPRVPVGAVLYRGVPLGWRAVHFTNSLGHFLP